MRRGFLVLAILSLLATSAASPESRVYEYINDRRVSEGLRALPIGSFLMEYAEKRARIIRANQRLLPHDGCYLCAEVLGATTGTAWSVFVAWMRSPTHHHILMLSSVDRIGCGHVSDTRGYHWWACEVR